MAPATTTGLSSVTQHLNPFNMVRNLWQHYDLLRQFTRRDIEGRYKGSFLGMLWSLVNPLVLLIIYTFVFGIVFQFRWPNTKVANLTEFALVIFCGITAFSIFAESVGRAPGLIVGVPNNVKKVVFPLEILPLSSIGAALFHALISLSILIVWVLFSRGRLPWTLPLLPLVALPLVFLSLGLSWFLASLGVFVRDMGYTIALLVQVLFYVTPIFYSIENVPEPFQTMIRYNPLTTIVENFRRVILWGILPDWLGLAEWLPVSGGLMVLGYAWFMKTKRAFADVI